MTATRKIITQLEGMQNEGAALLQAGVIKVDGMGESGLSGVAPTSRDPREPSRCGRRPT